MQTVNPLSPIFKIRFHAAEVFFDLWVNGMQKVDICRKYKVSQTTVDKRISWYRDLMKSEGDKMNEPDHIFHLDTTWSNIKTLLDHNIHSIETIRNYSQQTIITLFGISVDRARWLRSAIDKWEEAEKRRRRSK